MQEPEASEPRRVLSARIAELGGLDTVDTCRMRLLALRTRVETNWPIAGKLFKRGGLDPATRDTIADLLVALPTPLPLHAGGQPEPLIYGVNDDLRAVAGRAVDAALALLDRGDLEAIYPAQVCMLESHRPGAQAPIVVTDPTVGLVVATIIGTLEAIAEVIAEAPARYAAASGASTSAAAQASARPASTGQEQPGGPAATAITSKRPA
jgi:hypothetical protein